MGMLKPNLTDALFTKVQQRLLGVLYGQPDRSFHTNEIIRIAQSGRGSIQRELEKFTEVGLITSTVIGNQKHYQANHKNPLFSELRSIVLKTFGVANVLRDALNPIANKIDIAFIYGSIGKQEYNAQSDIDLLIISDKLTYADLFPLLEQPESKLGRSINPTFYTCSEWMHKKKAGNNFIIQLIKQPKIFIIGSEDEFEKSRKFSEIKAAETRTKK
jgi:predicted nucleotidyltransferase